MAIVNDSSPLKRRLRGLLTSVGRGVVHSLFPNDFEAYFISFELVDSKGNTEAFITFPVQPDSISEVSTRVTNVKKTAGGVVTVGTETFVPIDLEIKGTFGRNFKFTIGNKFVQAGLLRFIKSGFNTAELGRPSFSNQVKTGYGMIKAVEDMLDAADILDADGKPKKLYFYNTILGNNYIVKPKNFVHSQNIQSNMIPQYTIQLTAVAPVDLTVGQEIKKLGKSMALSVLNKEADSVARNIRSELNL